MGRKSNNKGVNRRDLIATGSVAGLGAAALSGAAISEAAAQTGVPRWDREADVVVVGSGAAGFPAAVRARDLGASVIIVEENDEVGGHAIISNAITNLGGGNAHQKKFGIEDTPDDVYLEYTRPDHPMTRYNDRDMIRAFADHNVEVYDYMVSKGVMFADEKPANALGEGSTIPRRIRMLRSSDDYNDTINNTAGSGLIRPLEKAARSTGVEILLKHRMVRIVREQPVAGRVIGIVVTNLANNRTVNIRARRAVIACTGGSSSNLVVRTIYDSRLTEEYEVGCEPYSRQSGDAEQQGMAIGASLGSTNGARNEMYLSFQKTAFIGCRFGYARWDPKGPFFSRAGASGVAVADYQDCILVNTIGNRFYDETVGRGMSAGSPLGWQSVYDYFAAAMSSAVKEVNGKKQRIGGPVWAICDADGVAREKWNLVPPYVDVAAGCIFSANTLSELAGKLNANKHQKYPMSGATLEASVARYNAFVDGGKDEDFGKPAPKYKVAKPPFYALWATPILHDTYAGLRVSNKWQVIDVFGKPIAGFYAAGECVGGMTQHGVARGAVGGYIAATDAMSKRG
jgi:succinate dehydrogenase/fumarate reductase flavoprotein subunit